MAEIQKHRGVIGILTGGGDVPGLNPAIRAVTIRALREGFTACFRGNWRDRPAAFQPAPAMIEFLMAGSGRQQVSGHAPNDLGEAFHQWTER